MKLGAITLFVEDLARAKEFYGRAFDRSPVFEDAESAAFRLDNAILNLLVSTAAGELITPAPVGAPTPARASSSPSRSTTRTPSAPSSRSAASSS